MKVSNSRVVLGVCVLLLLLLLVDEGCCCGPNRPRPTPTGPPTATEPPEDYFAPWEDAGSLQDSGSETRVSIMILSNPLLFCIFHFQQPYLETVQLIPLS